MKECAKPVTLNQILMALHEAGKPVSVRTVYLNLKTLGVKPISNVQQHPQLYPPDAAQRILARYGLAPRRLARA
jgi:hypothetical protein